MMRPPALIAIESIERAIRDLERPTGTVEEYGPGKLVYGGGGRSVYRAGEHPDGVFNPRDPEVVKVREALIGAAFTVAQAHAAYVKAPSATLENIRHVANYWKHRDEWDATWTPNNRGQQVTIPKIIALGASPPVVPGQLDALATKVLGQWFDADALWNAIQ